jgi:ribosome biogenesis GTPase
MDPLSAVRVGLVIAAYGRRGLVEWEGERIPYIIRGRTLHPVCGDRAHFNRSDRQGEAVVIDLEARRNALKRVAPRSGRAEVIAANITCIAVVCSRQPETDWFLVDRYLCTAHLLGCRGLLVWNKIDMGGAPEREVDAYRRLDLPVIEVSTYTGAGLARLTGLLDGHVSVLAGQSGVGKSSLINALVPDADALVGQISPTHAVGRHTTTASSMHRIGACGWLVDTPGVRNFLPCLDGYRPDEGFIEITRAAARCRFADCSHIHEPDCAVRAAVATGEIATRRYASYRELLRHHPGS